MFQDDTNTPSAFLERATPETDEDGGCAGLPLSPKGSNSRCRRRLGWLRRHTTFSACMTSASLWQVVGTVESANGLKEHHI
ncbi:hypothetical protein I7I48_03049 [Histoplasma ohiense]|nr:hypothetical protein I7I48_03049 [Histoplasma ohiense (nom. inval.)]